MLVFPPPFERKWHPRCAKQILDFTFLLQIVKGGVVQGKFLGWFGDWCFRWIHAQGELEGLSTHLLIFLNSISPLLIWMSLSPSTVSSENWHLHMGQTPFPTLLREVISCPFGSSCPALRRVFPHCWKHSETTEKKAKFRCFPWQVNLTCLHNFCLTPHSLPAPEEL